MRIKSILLFSALLVLVVATLSCKKKSPAPTPTPTAIPPTFSFTALGIAATGVQYTITNPQGGPLQVTGSNASNTSNYQTVQITVTGGSITAPGTFTLNATASSGGNSGVYTSGSGSFLYNTNASHTGSITVSKVDMVNRLISASFNFSAQEYTPTNTSSGTISGSFTNVGF